MKTVTLFFFIKWLIPPESRAATPRERSTTALRSISALPTVMPKSLAWSIKCLTSAERNKALVGMHPQLRQIPPKFSRSTTAAFSPNWLARIAATYPPGPPPITTRSKSCSAMDLSFLDAIRPKPIQGFRQSL